MGLGVGATGRGSNGHAARAGVFHDGAGGRVKPCHALQRRVDVHDVVVGKRCPGELGAAADGAGARPRLNVERRLLMGVLAITHGAPFAVGEREARWERRVAWRRAALRALEPGGDGRVVLGGVGERLGAEMETHGGGGAAGAQGVDHLAIVCRVRHHRHPRVVLRRAAQERRAADVDVRQGLLPGDAGGRDVREGVEVHHHEVDGRDAMLTQRAGVHVVPRQDAAMHLRVQRLHAAIQDLREAHVVRQLGGLDAGLGKRRPGASRREQRDAELGQRAGEGDDAGFVPDAQERPSRHAAPGLSHPPAPPPHRAEGTADAGRMGRWRRARAAARSANGRAGRPRAAAGTGRLVVLEASAAAIPQID